VLDVFEEATKKEAKAVQIEARIYFELGAIRGAHVSMTQSEMGGVGLMPRCRLCERGLMHSRHRL
jgi:hypothetical protein